MDSDDVGGPRGDFELVERGTPGSGTDNVRAKMAARVVFNWAAAEVRAGDREQNMTAKKPI
jgi:hypothetical protein